MIFLKMCLAKLFHFERIAKNIISRSFSSQDLSAYSFYYMVFGAHSYEA